MTDHVKTIFSIALVTISSVCSGQILVKPGNRHIAYQGRVQIGADSAFFYWPGTSATLNFEGTGIQATLRSRKELAFFYAIIDNDASKAIKFSSDSIKKTHHLALDLPYGKHSVMLYKITDNTSENLFYGFEITGNGKILEPTKPQHRKIEFYGNSITAGYGVDVPEGMKDTGAPEHFNNYYTYGALTARHYNAQYSCIARSGIGIMISWFPQIMPEVYNLVDPFNPESTWNFSNYTPNIVVVNLFQNDSWLIKKPDHEQFKARFGTTRPTEEFIIQSYQNFIANIRSKYPKAFIICVLGNMEATHTGSRWPGYINEAIENLNDPKLYSLFFPFKNTPDHPNREAQQQMANDLIAFIDRTIKW